MNPAADPGSGAVFAEIREEKRRAHEAGDQGRLAELEEMAAALHTASGNQSEARRALRRALRHHLELGDEASVAKAHYGLALLEARVPSRSAAARAGLQQALEGFRAAGQHEMAGRTLVRLAVLDISDQRYDDAANACREAADAFTVAEEPEDRVEALRLGAYAAQFAGNTSEAMGLFTAALTAAPSVDAALSIRLDASAVGLFEPPGADELDKMLADAGAGPMRGPLLLMRAAERAASGALAEAEAGADEARRIALDGPDPILYLQACLQVAGIREMEGDRVGMLTILFTCQASLGDLLGDQARVPVLYVIDSLRVKWGDEVFQSEMTRYRSQFEEAAP